MPRIQVLWEAHMRRFLDALDRHKQGWLTAEEAGELLGMSGRHFRRQCVRYQSEGEDGLRDKRVGRPSHRRAPEDELARMRRKRPVITALLCLGLDPTDPMGVWRQGETPGARVKTDMDHDVISGWRADGMRFCGMTLARPAIMSAAQASRFSRSHAARKPSAPERA